LIRLTLNLTASLPWCKWHFNALYAVSRKKWDQNVVLQYLLQTSGDSGEIWYIASWINLPLNRINVYHLTWIMSLHYLVNLKCSSRKCYHWAVRQKNSRILSLTSTARLQIRQIRNQLITACREYCKRRCTTRITDLDELNQRLRTEWAKLDHIFNAAATRQSSQLARQGRR